MGMGMGTNMTTDVTLIKPKPLRGSSRQLEHKSDAWERGVRPGSLRVAKESDWHLIPGSTAAGVGAEKAAMDPEVNVDCGPPVLASLRMVHGNIPVHGCLILEAQYPYSYEEFILQAYVHPPCSWFCFVLFCIIYWFVRREQHTTTIHDASQECPNNAPVLRRRLQNCHLRKS